MTDTPTFGRYTERSVKQMTSNFYAVPASAGGTPRH